MTDEINKFGIDEYVEKAEIYLLSISPAITKAVDLFIRFEDKYGEGLTLNNSDALKCSRHAISSHLNEENEDGASHAVAALARAIKMVLAECDQEDHQ